MSLLKSCRICLDTNLIELIDLGEQPWCNNFLKKMKLKGKILSTKSFTL